MANPIFVSDTRISSAEFGDFDYKRFLVWAFTERQSKAAFLRNIGVARTRDNLSVTDTALQHYCELYQLTDDELRTYIYLADQNNVSIAALHQRLEKGLRGDQLWENPKQTKKRKP